MSDNRVINHDFHPTFAKWVSVAQLASERLQVTWIHFVFLLGFRIKLCTQYINVIQYFNYLSTCKFSQIFNFFILILAQLTETHMS